MLSKLSPRILLFVSFVISLFSLSYFSFFKTTFVLNYLSPEAEKNFILLILSFFAFLLFFIYLILKKQITIPQNKYIGWLFLLIPITIILSTLFSNDINNSLFGKYISIQNAVSLLSVVFLVYLVSSNIKKFKALGWMLFAISNFLLTIPVIFAIILSKFGLINFSNKLVSFIDNWDTVAIVSGVIVVITLVYFETIAFSKKQKIISSSIIVIHLILIFCIIIPDVWYALSLSSLTTLLISSFVNKDKKINFYKKFSFYIFLVSILFVITFSLSNSWTKNITAKVNTFVNKYSGINYNFIKPKFSMSFNLGVSQLQKGKVFGAGPADFNNVWQQEKPNSVISSSYWDTIFTSSYSTFTTLFVTLGLVGSLAILLVIVSVIVGVYKNIKRDSENSYLNWDDENKFYFLSSFSLFIFATTSFFVFTNTTISIILFSLSLALISSNIITWKEKEVSKTAKTIFLVMLILSLVGCLVAINRVRSTSISTKSLTEYQTKGDLTKLESNLLRAARISGDDNEYRTLTQLYLYKAQGILSTTPATSTVDELQKNILSSINGAISSANTAINIDKENYNNYLSLASVYSFLMSIGGQNKEVYYQTAKDNYNKALTLYPKNPSIPLTLAGLEYSYNQNATNTLENIKKSLTIKPNYSSAYYILSQLAAQNNDRESALMYAGQAIQNDPKNIDAYLQYGILTLNKKELSKEELNQAYTAFISVLRLDQNNLTAAYYLSITYILAKDFDNAQIMITALNSLLPDNKKIIDLQNYLNSEKSPKTTTVKAKK